MARNVRTPERSRRRVAHTVALWETATRGATYNPLSQGVIQNPYGAYAELRRRSPVHRSKILGSWVLTRYEDVVAAAKDHRWLSNNPRWRGVTASVLPPAPDDYSILLMDPPDHSRLRQVAAKAFTNVRLAALSETITRSAAELVGRATRRGTIDWISGVAAPLSMRIMLTMMGLSIRDADRWGTRVSERARLLELIATRQERTIATRSGAEMQRYFRALLQRRRTSDGEDAISAIATQMDAEDGISMPEACDMLSVLMVAGNETTTNLIGNGMLALLRHPAQMQRLREEPERIHDAVEEMLRFDSPVQADFRISRAPISLRNRTLSPGDGVILLMGSANRDETAFEHPDTFDVTRKGPKHTSFGHGIHYCIGAELARMEARAVFTEVLRSTANIEIFGDQPQYRQSTVIRGLTALPLRLERR